MSITFSSNHMFQRIFVFWILVVWLSVCASSLLADEFSAKVVCDGTYPGHLQGICLDGEGNIYWSFTTWLVKTNSQGKLIQKVPCKSHHGDLCFADGKIYVAVNFGDFNNPKGNADSWVVVYRAKDLEETARHEIQEVKYGAGGIATNAGRFLVVGGLPHEIDENYLYEFDSDFKFVKKWTLTSGHTHLGILGATFAGGEWWFACYGSQLLRASANLEMKGRYSFECGYGIVSLGEQQFYIARGNRDQGNSGYLLRAVVDDQAGLKLLEAE